MDKEEFKIGIFESNKGKSITKGFESDNKNELKSANMSNI